MNIDDPHKLLDKKRLAAMCQIVGLPGPDSVTALGQPGRTMSYGIRFKASSGVPPQVLRLDMMNTAHGAPADHWVAANGVLQAIGLPARPTLVRLPDHVFSRPAVVYPFVELSTGQRLCALTPEFWPTAAQDLGKVVTELASKTQERFGIRALDGSFRAARGTWADEWIAHSSELLQGARAFGVDLGSLSTALHQAVLDRRDALASVEQFCLVHGELKPAALLYQIANGVPALAGLEGWDVAMIGDPLVEVAYLLTYPPDTLAPVLAGVGRDRVQAWLEPGALARIEAYHAALCATRPLYVAEQLRAVGGSSVVNVLEAARQHGEQALSDGFVEQRLREAVEITEPFGPPRSDAAPSQAQTLIRTAVTFGRGDAGISPAQAPILVASLGAALLGHQIAEDTLRSTASLEAAIALLRVAENKGRSERTEPIPDPDAWIAALAGDLGTEALQSRCSTSGLLLVWLLAEARTVLGTTLSDAVLRGVERTARDLAAHERALEPHPTLQAQHAIYGLAATVRLEALGVRSFPELGDALRDRLLDLIDPVEAASIPGGSGDEALLPKLADPSATAEQRLTRPLLILALRAVRGEPLPATEAAVLAWMGG